MTGMIVLGTTPAPPVGHVRGGGVRYLPSDRDAVCALVHRYERRLYTALGERGREIALGMDEILNNFAEHMNGYDPAKNIRFQTFRDDKTFYLVVGAEGRCEFDPAALKTRVLGDNGCVPGKDDLGNRRGWGNTIISCVANTRMYDKYTPESTGFGGIFYFDRREGPRLDRAA